MMQVLLLAQLLLLCLAADRPSYIGPRDRFWRHHRDHKTLVVDGVDIYEPIEECLWDTSSYWTKDELSALNTIPTNRTIGKRILDNPGERFGPVILVEVKNAMTPLMVKAVRRLSQCVERSAPKFHEVRPMYQEFNLPNDDDNLGGNSPTHLLPFLGIFLPKVVDDMFRTIQFAYESAGWRSLTVRDEITGSYARSETFPAPKDLGFRASEHLSYDDFPLLEAHLDGEDTAYTVNFAFSGPNEYQGGYLYIIDHSGHKTYLKPEKYSCMVLLGGHYFHGVTQITGGHREMFSNEMWFNPDLPLGTTLWTSNGGNMEEYIRKCNQEEDAAALAENRQPDYSGARPCTYDFSQYNDKGLTMEQIRKMYKNGDKSEWDEEEEYDGDEEEFDDEEEEVNAFDDLWGPTAPQEHDPRFLPELVYETEDNQPNFLIPQQLQPGQIAPLYYRDSRLKVRDDEAYVIGLPPQLLTEFTEYMDANGMLKIAKRLLYEENKSKKKEVEHELYTLEDGRKWGVMRPQWPGNDMVWIDPGDEECFESVMDILRKGDFDTVLDSIGKHFGLDGLMVQGIGPIFLSHFDHDPEYNQIHHDLIEAKGSFYNVIIPLYIPEDGAPLYVGDNERFRTIQMKYNVGTLLGAGTHHGTGEIDYRDKKDVRLSVAIYVADVNEDNVEIVASDSTSLWPTQGDLHWFRAQEGRLWKSDDPSTSLKRDKGRKRIDVKDKRPDCAERLNLCETDPAGFRLECPKTCKVYLEDDVYYSQLNAMVKNKSSTDQHPIHNTPVKRLEPTCSDAKAETVYRVPKVSKVA